MLALLVLACTPDDPAAPAGAPPARLEQLVMVGTHNSYHVQTTDISTWAYTHRPLGEQLDLGVRQFELDVYDAEGLPVYHVAVVDAGTTCPTLADCVGAQAAWSAAHPDHLPIVTLIETKTDGVAAPFLDALDEVLRQAWGASLFTPDELRGDAADLRTALATEGWPPLDTLRGRALYVLHEGGGNRDVYLEGGLDGRAMFPDAFGDTSLPFAAIHSMNDPFDPRIAEVALEGHLVRTRADSDGVEPLANDVGPRDAALASGAHWVSTDFPEPHPESGYVVEPLFRCNPVTAPEGCEAAGLEGR